MKILRERDGFMVFVGPWAGLFSWARCGRFNNGHRYWSGWHRWRDQPEW